MSLDEWEFLPDDGFLDYHDDGEKKRGLSGKRNSNPKSVFNFNMNYFMCPAPNNPHRMIEPSPPPPRSGNTRMVPDQFAPIQLDPTIIGKVPNEEIMREITIVPVDIGAVPPVIRETVKTLPDTGADQEAVSQVFFKKMKENEFVDMKMDSPKSSSRGIKPQLDVSAFNFEDKSEECKVEAMEGKLTSPRLKVENKDMAAKKGGTMDGDGKEEGTWEENSGGLNIWKWGFTGIGAICSFGVAAAATVCFIIIGSHQRNKEHQQNQKLRFQIYTDDKRIRQVVHHATKLNDAISAVRVVPLTRAHITFGGYYDGL